MFVFTVRPDGGEQFEVPAGTRDVLMWEKAGRDRSITALLGDMKVSDLYAIAHFAARRAQLFTGTLAEFEASCEIVTDALTAGPEPEPDPTRPGPSTGPSSPSPSTPASRRKSGQSKRSG